MRILLFPLLIWIVFVPAAAGQDEAVFGDIVSVELVLVDVFIEDQAGQPLLDLSQNDFELFEDGKPVEIGYFTPPPDVSTSGPVPARLSPDEAAAAHQPGRVVIFVDNLHLHPNSRRRVFSALTQRLDQYLTDQDEVMVVAFAGTSEVVLPMTSNRAALKKALREQASSPAISLLAGYNDAQILSDLQRVRAMNAQASNFLDQACRDVGHLAHSHALQVQARVLGTISELDRFVNSLAGYDGRKVLLHISDGIPLVAGAEAYLYASELCDGTGISKGIPNAIDTTASQGLRMNYWDPTQTALTLREFDTTDEWTNLAAQANTYQVSFYTFQARQPTNRSSAVDTERTSVEVEMEGARNKQDALFFLADETGGVAVLDSNDIESSLAQISTDSVSGYQLAYESPSSGDGREHDIRVVVSRPGVQVRHRKSYRSKSVDERVADHLMSTLLHGKHANPLAVRLEVAQVMPGEGATANIQLQIEVPLDRLVLLPEADTRKGIFTVYLVARNQFGQITPIGQKNVPIRLPEGASDQDFVYTVELPMRGEEGEVAIAVQDLLGAEVSYLRKRVRLKS